MASVIRTRCAAVARLSWVHSRSPQRGIVARRAVSSAALSRASCAALHEGLPTRLSGTTRAVASPRALTLRRSFSAVNPHGKEFTSDAELQAEIHRYAQMDQTGISLGGLREFGDRPDALKGATLLAAATFLHHELPIRLAHRIVELQELPYGLSDTTGVTTVRSWYVESFEELLALPTPKSAEDEARFTRLIEKIYQRHSPTLVNMAAGLRELRETLGFLDKALPRYLEVSIFPFLDAFFMSRIGIRTLIEQHIALHDPTPGWVGVINKQTSPHEVATQAIEQARYMCERSLGIAPECTIHGSEGFTFPYLSSHLHHMLFELVKNSMRAVVEFHGKGRDDIDEDDLPQVRVIISAGDAQEDVVIKVADEGGGIPRSSIDRIWSYFFTTAEPALEKLMQGDDFTVDTPLAGLGYGLPLSRLYARYYGGELQVISMEGYGTDAYLHLKRAGDSAEPVQVANISRQQAFREQHEAHIV